jgi:TPR repeat protein
MYADGQGVARDEAQAAVWLRKAADQGLPRAQYKLGVMYEKGQGVAQDNAQALAWYRKAADQGFEEAKSRLNELK